MPSETQCIWKFSAVPTIHRQQPHIGIFPRMVHEGHWACFCGDSNECSTFPQTHNVVQAGIFGGRSATEQKKTRELLRGTSAYRTLAYNASEALSPCEYEWWVSVCDIAPKRCTQTRNIIYYIYVCCEYVCFLCRNAALTHETGEIPTDRTIEPTTTTTKRTTQRKKNQNRRQEETYLICRQRGVCSNIATTHKNTRNVRHGVMHFCSLGGGGCRCWNKETFLYCKNSQLWSANFVRRTNIYGNVDGNCVGVLMQPTGIWNPDMIVLQRRRPRHK